MDYAAFSNLCVQLFGEHWGAVVPLLLMGFCAFVSMLTPAPMENSSALYKAFYSFVNTIGANAFKARNADEVKKL